LNRGQALHALQKENRILFEEMLDRCKKTEDVDCAAAKGENFSTEALFLVLIFEQQKMRGIDPETR